MTADSTRSRLALVIGSGGVKCAAAIGVQQALRDEGIEIGLVVGCSGGAIYAAAAALGWTVEQTIEQTLQLWTRDTTSQPRRLAMLRAVFPRLLGFSSDFSFRDDRLLNARLRQGFGLGTFGDTRIPLYITATDFNSGEQVVLSEGPLWEAVRASIAIPLVFAPRRVNGRLLMDGFLSDPLPVNVAIQERAGVILAIGFESPNLRRFTTPMRVGLQLTSVMTNNLLRSRFAFHNLTHHAEVIPILPEFQKPVGIFDTSQIPYVIEEGRRAALAHIPYIRRLMAESAP
jgi:NTE family protein